jgi:hypothetical protein
MNRMKYLIRAIIQFTFVSLFALLLLGCWCVGVKYYFDNEIETSKILRNENPPHTPQPK